MMAGRAPTSGIIVIPPAKRFPYGDDLAAARSAGRARASVRSRVGHLIERPSGYRAARVSRSEGIRTSSGTATAVARAGDRPASQGRTRAATQMKPLGVTVQHLTNPSHRSYYESTGQLPIGSLTQTRRSPEKPGRFSSAARSSPPRRRPRRGTCCRSWRCLRLFSCRCSRVGYPRTGSTS